MTIHTTSPQHVLLAALTEREWQLQVVSWARRGGWRAYHTYNSRRSASGFPDLVLVKAGRRVIYAELKSETGRITVEQQDWLDALAACPLTDVRVWRPSDAPEVQRTLDVLP